MSKTITKSKYGWCEFCDKTTYTLNFDDEEKGYEGWHVEFEICLGCYNKLMGVLEVDKEYSIRQIYNIMKTFND